MQVAEVDQGMSHGGEIALGPLDLKYLSIALFRSCELVHECAGIAQVAKRIRQRLLIVGSPIVGHSRFPGSAGLNQIAAMEKNSCAMLMIIAHERSAISNQPSELKVFQLSTHDSTLSTISY